jgi:hypothetical protein
MIGGLPALGFIVALFGTPARAQSLSPAADIPGADWLNTTPGQQTQAAAGGTVTATAGHDVKDPFSVLSTGSLWQERYDAVYTRRLDDALSLNYETRATTFSEAADPASSLTDGSADDLSSGQKLALQFRPADILTLRADLHDSTTGADLPGDSAITGGAGFWAEGRLPANSVLSLGLNTDRTGLDSSAGDTTTLTACDAQFQQPFGKLPLTAMLKGHYEEIANAGAPVGRSPSLEQSLVWKPMQDSSVQLGLRQQQYQEYPGISDQFNQAIFADWSQKIVGDVSWHSYAEVLNSHGLINQAPAAPATSGANGSPQATPPGSNANLTSSLPVSLEDQTLTFSTGPSFRLQKDISASIEYSDRWDRNPAPGGIGQEQRVSVSVKGTF